MNIYITVADVTDILGVSWFGDGDADLAVLQANAWLSAKGVATNDPVDADVVLAGAYLAKEASINCLYADSEPTVKRKRVKADSVESETEYMDGYTARTGQLRFVHDLLRPFLPAGGGSNFDVRRA
jgi:hypothetical protein